MLWCGTAHVLDPDYKQDGALVTVYLEAHNMFGAADFGGADNRSLPDRRCDFNFYILSLSKHQVCVHKAWHKKQG